MLLAALEPAAERALIETALVLLGVQGASVAVAAELGMLRVLGDVVDLVDGRVRRVVVDQATDGERRRAHLALAVARCGGSDERRPSRASLSRCLFDDLARAIDGEPTRKPEHEEGDMPRLTVRERQVATIAATGLSTREIATRTAMSPKTVKFYLTRIYRKLGVRCRAELASAYGPR